MKFFLTFFILSSNAVFAETLNFQTLYPAQAVPRNHQGLSSGQAMPLDLQLPNLVIEEPLDLEPNTPVVISRGSGVLRSSALHSVCREIRENHLEDLNSLEKIYRELQANVDHADKVSELVSQIKEISSRIRFVAKPEWNSENIPVEIYWKIPHALFFDNSEYLDLKYRVQNEPLNPQLFRKYVDEMTKKSSITEKKLIHAEYLGSANPDIAGYLTLDALALTTEYGAERSFHIRIKKNVTALEACQFLNTMLFEVQISYDTHLRIVDKWFRSEKSIFLIYRNEEASAN